MAYIETVTHGKGVFNGNTGITEGQEYTYKYECDHCHIRVDIDHEHEAHQIGKQHFCKACFDYYNEVEE